MPCSICNYPQRRAIDLALLSGSQTLDSLEQQYGGPSRSAFWRHKNHLQDRLFQARKRLQRSQAQVSLLKLNGFLDHIEQAVQTAAAEGHVDRVIKGSYTGSRILCQINKLEVPLELETVYRLISSPEFVSRDFLLPAGPQIITELHQALVDQAFFPCPEPSPPAIPASDEDAVADDSADDDYDQEDHEDEEEFAEADTQNASPKTEAFFAGAASNPHLEALHLLQQHFPDLDLSEDALSSLPEIKPENKRDTGATKARQNRDNPPLPQKKSFKFNDIILSKKIPTEDRDGAPANDTPLAHMEVPLPPDPLETQDAEPGTAFNSELETDFPSAYYPPDIRVESPGTGNPGPKSPPPYDETARRADELFLMTHGYPRNNPPKHIPNRRREEDFRSQGLFGDPSKIFG